MKKDAADLLRARVSAAIPQKFKHISDVAEKAGIHQGNFSDFMNGKRKSVNLETAWKLFTVLGPSDDVSAATIQRMGAHSPKIVVSEDDKLIDVYHVAGAGPGWEIVEVEPITSIRVPISFSAQASFAVVVEGDSMNPTLQRGSVVGVREGVPFYSNEIYAVRPPDEGMSVKRVIRDHQRNGYILRSDNPNKDSYADVFIPAALAEYLIVGRVVWVWQGV